MLEIKPIRRDDIPDVIKWAREEGFSPGIGDINIYRQTDRQGVWVGWIDRKPIGCIAGVKYNKDYGFIGLYIISKKYRGKGYGIQLWKNSLDYLKNTPCIGLEAEISRVNDYQKWGFNPSAKTTRWQINNDGSYTEHHKRSSNGIRVVYSNNVKNKAISVYDSRSEIAPRPHFLSDWLSHPAGSVMILLDDNEMCHGFGRIRPCLFKSGEGWRIGPLLADDIEMAEQLINSIIDGREGRILIDSPGTNKRAEKLMQYLGFRKTGSTIRMYKGKPPQNKPENIYGLACLELG